MLTAAVSSFAVSLIVIAAQFDSGDSGKRDDVDTGCAPRSVCVALRLMGREVSSDEIRDAFGGRLSGSHSSDEIKVALTRLGLASRFARLDPASPRLGRLPFIAGLRGSHDSTEPDHFVVLYGVRNGALQVLDFPYSPRFVPCDDFAESWDGRGLYVAAAEKDLPLTILDGPLMPGVLAGSAIAIALVSLAVCFRKRSGGNAPEPRATDSGSLDAEPQP